MKDQPTEIKTATGETINVFAQDIETLIVKDGSNAELLLKNGKILIFSLTKSTIPLAYEYLALQIRN